MSQDFLWRPRQVTKWSITHALGVLAGHLRLWATFRPRQQSNTSMWTLRCWASLLDPSVKFPFFLLVNKSTIFSVQALDHLKKNINPEWNNLLFRFKKMAPQRVLEHDYKESIPPSSAGVVEVGTCKSIIQVLFYNKVDQEMVNS